MTTIKSPEKPRHIDGRINRIGTDDLIKAFGAPTGVDDLGSLRAFVAQRMRRPAWPLPEWADALRSGVDGPGVSFRRSDETGSSPAVDEVLAAASPLLRGVDVTGRKEGRSRRYGFHYLGWLSPGIQAWLLTGDDRYLTAFEQHFDDWFSQRDSVTGEWPGLDVIWYSLGTWARCRNLLPTLEVLTSSSLSDRVWGRLVATLVGGARWAYDEHDVFRHGNWQLVCATELLHLSAVLPELVEADSWASRARERIHEHLLLDVYGDGGHYERSPGYHKMCLTALQTAAMIDPQFAEHSKLTAMHEWLCELASAEGWIPHLQDSHIEWPALSLLRGGYVLDNPALVRTAAQWLTPAQFATEAAMLPAWEDTARQQRWMDALATAPDLPVPQPARSTVLADSGYVILRGGELRAVINYGPHIEHELESHSHRAVLDLVLEGWGQPLLWEAGGPPSYDDPEYLTWYQSGRGHNTVLVDDRELGTDRGVTVDPLVDTAHVAVFNGRHHGNGLPQSRTIAMVREEPAFVVISDRAPADDHVFRACWQALHPWRQLGPLTYDASPPDGPGLLLIEAAAHQPPATDQTGGTGADSADTAGVDSADRASAHQAPGPDQTGGTGADSADRAGVDSADRAGAHQVPGPDQAGGAGVELVEGVARRPVGQGVAEYGPLHSLVLTRDCGDFTTVLVPHEGAEAAEVRVTQVGARLEVDHGSTVDRIDGSSWVRTVNEKLSWATGWRLRELRDGDQVVMRSAAEVDVEATVVDGGLRLEVTSSGRCGLWVRPGDVLRLDGVPIAAESDDEGWAQLTLPYAGRWTIEGVRHV
ncbi:heparinase II/III family protein [Kribbella sp. NPDC050470]|uniref:heparinase II/III family protein n=1 Tax=unclassified Kribbella TaxID=2644121 RepID=UPI00378ECDB6